jgi:hypothetical protein
LRASIASEGTLLRIELHLAGDDPRIALRERQPEYAELRAIMARLVRIDVACPTPWTTRYLQLIADQPGIVSRVLARQVASGPYLLGGVTLQRFKCAAPPWAVLAGSPRLFPQRPSQFPPAKSAQFPSMRRV